MLNKCYARSHYSAIISHFKNRIFEKKIFLKQTRAKYFWFILIKKTHLSSSSYSRVHYRQKTEHTKENNNEERKKLINQNSSL